MTISWHGFNYFKLQNTNSTLILNPYSLDKVTTFGKSKANVILFSNEEKIATSKIDQGAFLISSPGEYEINNIFIYGRQIKNNIIYLINFEDIRIAFLGELGHEELSNHDLELIEDADILILPVGGGDLCTAKEAAKIVSQVEPRIVIPACHSAGSFKLKTDNVTSFIKEFGVKPIEEDKYKIQKKNLPQEDVQLVVLKLQK